MNKPGSDRRGALTGVTAPGRVLVWNELMMMNRPLVRMCVLCIGLATVTAESALAQTIVRIAPIVKQTATPIGSERFAGVTPPTSAVRVAPLSTFYVEIWATNVGAPLDGLACAYANVLYDRTDLIDAVAPIQDSSLFPINAVAPAINDVTGTVSDVGGCQTVPAIPGLGVAEWVLVERIQMSALTLGGPITVSAADNNNPFAGTSILGQLNNTNPANIEYQVRVFQVAECTINADCGDGVACTIDTCTAGVCTNAPTNSLCDDTLFCNGVETCSALLDCQAGTPPTLTDGVICTDDTCDELLDVIVHTVNNANCDDTLFCNGAETCDALLDCQAGTNPCPGQLCDDIANVCVDCLLNSDCDDGLFCNGAETCVGGLCNAGVAVACGDAVACTVDTCDEVADLCVNTPTDALCSNGQFCDGVETCDALLGCQIATPVNCNDGVACTTGDSCDEINDICVNTPNNTLCNNALFCDGVETCDPVLGCQAGAAVTCDDAVVCTVDTCDEINDLCLNIATDGLCDDGLFCDGVETCDPVLDCQAGTPLTCDDLVGCTVDSCDELINVCVNTPIDVLCNNTQFCDGVETCDALLDCQAGVPVNCSDGVACTTDACDEVNDVCVSTPNNAACNNGLFCDGVETCDAVLGCQASTFTCDDGVACTLDTCNEVAGSCVFTPVPGCQTCVNPIDCTDTIACTQEACVAGVCIITPNDQLCGNGVFCDGVETCDLVAGCQLGTPVICDDGVGCTLDTCDEFSATCVSTANNALCDNGQFCDGTETCDTITGCLAGTTPCNDGIACTIDACNEMIDTCVPVPIDSVCNNALYCDGLEVCHPLFGCEPGVAPCDDGLSCSLDTCNENTGDCTNTLVDALCDDGDILNGQEFCDPNLDCQPGQPLDLIRIAAVVRQLPSGLDITTGAPPAGDDALQEAAPFVVELWAQQLQDPANPPLFGLCCVFADLDFSSGLMSCSNVVPSPQFSSFASGSCGTSLVNEIGGCTVTPPLGVTPQWVRVATVNMTADVPGFGNTIATLPAGTANSICQYGSVPVAQIQYVPTGTFRIGNPCMYDLDGDDCIGPGDMAFFAPCWLTTNADPEWNTFNCGASDFDCSGSVDPGDLAFFASGWLKCCDDPSIVFPPLPCGVAAGQALPPADRKTVESFGLTYPEDVDTNDKPVAGDTALDRTRNNRGGVKGVGEASSPTRAIPEDAIQTSTGSVREEAGGLRRETSAAGVRR